MSKNLIFSRRHDDLPMTPMEIEHRAPSVYAIDKAPHLSERYGQVTTARAIKVMMDHGFYPVQAAQVGKGRHAKHMLAFSPEYHPSRHTESRPELILYNSHDGTSSLKLFAGFYRFICSNGIVAGQGFEARLRHTGSTVSGFEDLISRTAGRLPDLMSRMDNMRTKNLSTGDALEFIKTAAGFRWKEELITDNTVSDIYNPRRASDSRNDLWTVFNRAQESLVRGGVRVGPKDRKARALGSINSVLEVNTQLWALTE